MPGPDPALPARLARFMHGSLWFGIALLGTGVLLQLGIRDRLPLLAMLYYALPLPLLAGLALLLAAVARRMRRRRLAGILLAAALGLGSWWLGTSGQWHAAPPTTTSLRLLFWNTMHNRWPPEGYAAVLRASQADLIGLVEAPTLATDWERLVPGYAVAEFGAMKLLVRGRLGERRETARKGVGRVCNCTVFCRGREYQVILVDFESAPWRDRRLAFDLLDAAVVPANGRPLVVMGDFNTPAGSTQFDRLADRVRRVRPRLLGETWPVPLPVLALDHVLLGPELRPLDCRRRFNWRSDHVALEVDCDTLPKP